MISVHAISMLYELRALRSRLADMVEDGTVRLQHEQQTLEWALAYTNNLINKVERTDAYIKALEADRAILEEAAQAGLGESSGRRVHRHRDDGSPF